MENINSWKDINWRVIENTVFRLQLRIFQAAKDQEYSKLYKLQKLLTNSKSAKYLAVHKVTQDNAGKRTAGVDNHILISPEARFVLANQLMLDGKSSPVRSTCIKYPNGKRRLLRIPTIEDRAKQALSYLALCPQWESQFEATSYGFRPGRSVIDAIETVFLGISKKPKWVLDADISKCFDEINHQYLLDKCNTYPFMRRQLRAWLKAGILDGKDFVFPEMGTPQGGVISPLLANIALHGLKDKLDEYINSLGGHRQNNRQSLTYVRYADEFVLMHPDRNTLVQLKKVVQEFLSPIGLELHPNKTRIVHTYDFSSESIPGFTFLGFDVVQKPKRIRQREATGKVQTKQKFITLITPSKEGVIKHRLKLRDTIRRYKGAKQERLIQVLNPIIRGWALSKRSQIASRTFQALDAYLWLHLWKWARKRHPKMSKVKLKEMYWHKVGYRNWVFGVKKNEEVVTTLQLHHKISIVRHVKVKGEASPYDGNLIYWATRTGKSPLMPPMKAQFVKEQKGRWSISQELFFSANLPDNIIERDHIVPKALAGSKLRDNVHAVHRYCHLSKTRAELSEIRRHRNQK